MSDQTNRTAPQKWLKDPLVHFLVLGGLLFALVSFWGPENANISNSQKDIIVTQAGQKHLADLFELTWQRKPTQDELNNLIEDHIKEEIYYREALALGLDENDTIVRRRLRQKLEFMQEDLNAQESPSEAELKAYFTAHQDQYMTEHLYSFEQVLVSPKKLSAQELQNTEAPIKIRAGKIPLQKLSRSNLLPLSIKLETQKTVGNTFGADFTQQLAEIKGDKMGQWIGPIYSGFGTHMVRLSRSLPAKPLSFAQARDRVERDYLQARREQTAEDFYKNLRDQYRIKIESPD